MQSGERFCCQNPLLLLSPPIRFVIMGKSSKSFIICIASSALCLLFSDKRGLSASISLVRLSVLFIALIIAPSPDISRALPSMFDKSGMPPKPNPSFFSVLLSEEKRFSAAARRFSISSSESPDNISFMLSIFISILFFTELLHDFLRLLASEKLLECLFIAEYALNFVYTVFGKPALHCRKHILGLIAFG